MSHGHGRAIRQIARFSLIHLIPIQLLLTLLTLTPLMRIDALPLQLSSRFGGDLCVWGRLIVGLADEEDSNFDLSLV